MYRSCSDVLTRAPQSNCWMLVTWPVTYFTSEPAAPLAGITLIALHWYTRLLHTTAHSIPMPQLECTLLSMQTPFLWWEYGILTGRRRVDAQGWCLTIIIPVLFASTHPWHHKQQVVFILPCKCSCLQPHTAKKKKEKKALRFFIRHHPPCIYPLSLPDVTTCDEANDQWLEVGMGSRNWGWI